MNPNFSIKEIASVEQYEYQSETYTIMMVEGEGEFCGGFSNIFFFREDSNFSQSVSRDSIHQGNL